MNSLKINIEIELSSAMVALAKLIELGIEFPDAVNGFLASVDQKDLFEVIYEPHFNSNAHFVASKTLDHFIKSLISKHEADNVRKHAR